jgi:hypothetical protein
MKRDLSIIIFFLWFLSCMHLLPRQPNTDTLHKDPNPAGKVVKKFIQASGGSNLQKIRTEKRTGTLIRGASGAVPFEMIATVSGKWHYSQVFAYGDLVNYGFDGVQAWIQDTQSVSVPPLEECLELAMLLDIKMPLKLEQIFPEMRVKGSERIGKKEAVVIAVTSREGIRSELAFDVASGLLLRAGDLFFEDYRNVGNVKRPFTIFFGKNSIHDPLLLKMQVSEIQQNVDVDDSVFSRPICPLNPGQPLLYKLRRNIPVSRKALEACVGVYQSADDPNVFYTITIQEDHLMIERTGWGTRVEILPESETDYFMRFLNREFHFIKDASGQIIWLELGMDRTQKAKKIK